MGQEVDQEWILKRFVQMVPEYIRLKVEHDVSIKETSLAIYKGDSLSSPNHSVM